MNNDIEAYTCRRVATALARSLSMLLTNDDERTCTTQSTNKQNNNKTTKNHNHKNNSSKTNNRPIACFLPRGQFEPCFAPSINKQQMQRPQQHQHACCWTRN